MALRLSRSNDSILGNPRNGVKPMALRLSRSNDSILGNLRNGVKPMALRLSRFSSAISASPPTPLQGERGVKCLAIIKPFICHFLAFNYS